MSSISSISSISPTPSTGQNYVGTGASSPKKDEDSKRCNQIFGKAIDDQSSVNSPSISEHDVSFHTSSETGCKTTEGVQEEEPSTELKTPEVEKKKKKKNKPSKKSPSHQKKAVASLALSALGQSPFDLPPMLPSPPEQAVSLYSQPYCPSFNDSEKKLLNEILEGDIFFESSNLLKVFIGEFYKDWVKFCSLVRLIDKNYITTDLDIALRRFDSKDVFTEVFTLESSLLKYRSDKKTEAFKRSHPSFESQVSPMRSFLDSYIEDVPRAIKNASSKITEDDKTLDSNTIVFFNLLAKFLQSHEDKCNLLSKCLAGENAETFCSETNTSFWMESVEKQIQTNEQKLDKFKQLSCFIGLLFGKIKSLNLDVELRLCMNGYINPIKSIVSGRINIKVLADSVVAYKRYALYSAKKIAVFKALDRNPKISITILDQYRNTRYDMELIDKWMSDLHEAVCFQFYEEFNDLGVSSPLAHVERLHAMIDIARTGVDKITRSKEDDSSSDPFVKSIRESISKLTLEIEDEFHKSNDLKKNLQTNEGEFLQNLLKEELQKKPFQLTHLFSEMPKSMKTEIKGGKINTLIKEMNETLCNMVRDAKSNNRLGDWTAEDLKEKIQEILLDETLELCVYLLIRAEINNLCSEDQVSGFKSFLPNETGSFH